MAIPSWITVNPISGSGNKTILITAQRNTEVSDRSFSLKVATAGGVTKEITITQNLNISQFPARVFFVK